MEGDFQAQLQTLNGQLGEERARKAKLDKELAEVKHELDNIEERFPEELSELRDQIKFAKEQTLDFEQKTKALQSELAMLRSQKK